MDGWNTKTRFLCGVKVAYLQGRWLLVPGTCTPSRYLLFFSCWYFPFADSSFADSVRIWDIFKFSSDRSDGLWLFGYCLWYQFLQKDSPNPFSGILRVPQEHPLQIGASPLLRTLQIGNWPVQSGPKNQLDVGWPIPRLTRVKKNPGKPRWEPQESPFVFGHL